MFLLYCTFSDRFIVSLIETVREYISTLRIHDRVLFSFTDAHDEFIEDIGIFGNGITDISGGS